MPIRAAAERLAPGKTLLLHTDGLSERPAATARSSARPASSWRSRRGPGRTRRRRCARWSMPRPHSPAAKPDDDDTAILAERRR
jgi:hypothetical protein